MMTLMLLIVVEPDCELFGLFLVTSVVYGYALSLATPPTR
jgi:hypothetical protein